ncbi:MAG TPA: histidine kinase, partial [Paenibacillus sp.]|nr:histidine kinase [Paenibacillus sp.]
RNVKHGDFTRLFGQFNRMAARMQHLIEKVFREELRAKEAVMKQLQSQINPHFLYNSLAFIVSMAQLKRTEPVISMAYSLADYYRYTTRNEKLDATVREEIAFVSNYVEIMDMQLRKISYHLDVPETLAGLHVPRLLFQPLVENSILHGLEPKEGPGTIRIEGRVEAGYVVFVVEDDGVGMPDDALRRLNDSLAASDENGDIRGLRNVHQRIAHRFGADAGLSLVRAASGGIRATLRWPAESADSKEGET